MVHALDMLQICISKNLWWARAGKLLCTQSLLFVSATKSAKWIFTNVEVWSVKKKKCPRFHNKAKILYNYFWCLYKWVWCFIMIREKGLVNRCNCTITLKYSLEHSCSYIFFKILRGLLSQNIRTSEATLYQLNLKWVIQIRQSNLNLEEKMHINNSH